MAGLLLHVIELWSDINFTKIASCLGDNLTSFVISLAISIEAFINLDIFYRILRSEVEGMAMTELIQHVTLDL